MFTFLHRLMSNAVEGLMRVNMAKAQLKDAPPAPTSSGAVHRPSAD